jgi:murein DD-endopeptidase MepM/ murein hydrolase activator NlpD
VGELNLFPREFAMQKRLAALRTALVGAVTGVVVVGTAVTAWAVPAPPPNPTDTQITDAATAQQAAAAEVGRIAALVAQSESDLEKYSMQAEAAGAAYDAAVEALAQAQAQADQAAADLQTAQANVDAASARIAEFSRTSYIDGHTLSSASALLDANGPGELVQRAAMIDWVANNQVDVLGQFEDARIQQANADAAARAARDQQKAAEDQAQEAKQTADSQLAAQQAAFDQVTAQKAQYEQQLQDAQIHLLELQGARNAYEQWAAQKAAEEAAAAAAQRAAAAGAASQVPNGHDYVLPAAGRTSSCFGSRWGVQHLGQDIAAPIGTPIYAATSGVVKRAGTATGFGLAVYILGDDGAVTVYGHVNRYFVEAGERVRAGQQIAEVGNRGQSTGPHLHFEVHPDGAMYSGAVNPGPWMRARGVALEGC